MASSYYELPGGDRYQDSSSLEKRGEVREEREKIEKKGSGKRIKKKKEEKKHPIQSFRIYVYIYNRKYECSRLFSNKKKKERKKEKERKKKEEFCFKCIY